MKHPTKRPKRTRKPVNITLSDDAHILAEALTEASGLKFSQLVEIWVRDDAEKRKLVLPRRSK